MSHINPILLPFWSNVVVFCYFVLQVSRVIPFLPPLCPPVSLSEFTTFPFSSLPCCQYSTLLATPIVSISVRFSPILVLSDVKGGPRTLCNRLGMAIYGRGITSFFTSRIPLPLHICCSRQNLSLCARLRIYRNQVRRILPKHRFRYGFRHLLDPVPTNWFRTRLYHYNALKL